MVVYKLSGYNLLNFIRSNHLLIPNFRFGIETSADAMKLRELQTYQEIGTERNTLMMVIPSSMANASGNFLIPLGVEQAKRDEERHKKSRKR